MQYQGFSKWPSVWEIDMLQSLEILNDSNILTLKQFFLKYESLFQKTEVLFSSLAVLNLKM